jgi:hypothetical protein
LRKLRHNQAIVNGVCGHKEVKIVSERNYKGKAGTITRTKQFFKYPKENALLLFDYDVKPNVEPLSHDAWLNAMSEVLPCFEQTGYVVTPSTSACIYDKDGHQLTGEGNGFHHYIIILDPADIPRFNDTLFKRLWLAGRGYIFISRSGAQLERTIYDQFVMSPERLDFVAGAVCRDGLEQRLPDPVYVAGGALDTTLLPSLSKSEEAEFERLVEQAKQSTQAEADAVRADYLKTEAPRLAKLLNVSHDRAREILSTRICGKLSGDDLLEFDNGGFVNARDILKKPKKYHLKTLRDPVEPEQGKYKAKLFVNEDKSIIVNSCLHGGRTYQLRAGEDSSAQDDKAPEKPPYTVVDIHTFLAMELPPRDNILAPWLPRQGLAMIHSKRGIGKTFVALNIAYAVACGSTFLRWQVLQSRGVLFIDGEMPCNVIQERLAQIVQANELEPQKPLHLMSPDLQDRGMPDLSTIEGQKAVNGYLSQDIELVILDNISTLSRSGKENEAQSWLPLQEWALRLRAQGKSVLFIHHSGKTGLQRGTSKREDILDTVISLRHTVDYEPMQGACFEIHFEKSRGIYGADVEPFEARLEGGLWTMKDLKTSSLEKVISLTKDGYSQKEIADKIGKTKGYISKLVKQAKAKR